MPGCEALKSSATLRSTWTCSGASPVPRQQYQRIVTSPGLACDSFAGRGVGGRRLADSDEGPDLRGGSAAHAGRAQSADGTSETTAVDDDGADDAVDWLHAANISASTARRTANRPVPTLMRAPSVCVFPWMSRSPARSSYAYGGFDRGRPDRPVDLTFDEIPGAIAAYERPAELDPGAFGVERDTFDEERRGTPSLIEEAGLSSPEEYGLEGLARAHDLGAVTRGQKL